MSFLLDTNVISETRKRNPDPNVLAWLQGADQKDLYVSVLTIGEPTKAIALHRRRDPGAAAGLAHWLRGIEELFADRIILIDAPIARTWGEVNAERPLPVVDSLLAATAKVRGFTLVSRNVKDVRSTGVVVVNPWDE